LYILRIDSVTEILGLGLFKTLLLKSPNPSSITSLKDYDGSCSSTALGYSVLTMVLRLTCFKGRVGGRLVPIPASRVRLYWQPLLLTLIAALAKAARFY
jgi:hypothetical protein